MVKMIKFCLMLAAAVSINCYAGIYAAGMGAGTCNKWISGSEETKLLIISWVQGYSTAFN